MECARCEGQCVRQELGSQCLPQSFSRANAAATHAGQGCGARVTRARATSMEDRCTGSAPSRLAHGSAARGMLGADGADIAARREKAARQSSSRHTNESIVLTQRAEGAFRFWYRFVIELAGQKKTSGRQDRFHVRFFTLYIVRPRQLRHCRKHNTHM